MLKRLVMIVAAVALVGALIGGSTFAFYSATATPSTNTFTAGTLKVALTDAGGNALTGPFMTFDNMAPGDTSDPYQANVKNTGSLAQVYNLSFARTDSGGTAADAVANSLSLKVERQEGANWVTVADQALNKWIADAPSEWQPKVDAGEMARLRFTVHLDLATEDPAQTGSVKLTLLVIATQPSVVQGAAKTWKGTYVSVEGHTIRFAALVTMTGNSFTGTMTELDYSDVVNVPLSGTISGNTLGGNIQYPNWGTVGLTGTLEPDGTVAFGNWSFFLDAESTATDSWTATKQ